MIAIAWILNFGSWNFIFYLDVIKNDFIIQLITWLVILAAITKSAQIPFSSWLPAAIAAPTPVSSLVHSSTLVTAGVYLLIRFNFSFRDEIIIILLFISSITIFMSGLGANFEFDLKKIIALSTLSQLGLIIRILSLGEYKLAFFHLLIHALFKALLFMCAGNIIHNLNNCQDIRYIGGLIKHLPLTCTYLNICNLSLCGFPFMSGFYSKDLIVEILSFSYLNIYIYIIFYISIGLTVAYRFRLTYYSLTGRFNYLALNILSETGYLILKGIRGLILFVVFSGRLFSWLVFSTPIFICLPFLIKIITLIFIIVGVWLGYELAKFKISYNLLRLNNISRVLFFRIIWNIPFLSTLGINYYPIYFGIFYKKFFDIGWFEYYGSSGVIKQLNNRIFLQLFSLNHLKIYLLLLIFWLIFLLLNIYYLNSL